MAPASRASAPQKKQFHAAALRRQGQSRTHARQRGPACRCRREKAPRPEPAARHDRSQPAEHADAAQRQRPKPVQQQPQRRPGRAGRKAVLPKPSTNPDQKASVPRNNGPAACKSHCHSRQPAAAGRSSARRASAARCSVLPPHRCQTRIRSVIEKLPAFRRGVVVLFPALSAYTVARARAIFGAVQCSAANRPKDAKKPCSVQKCCRALWFYEPEISRSAFQLPP